jgi:hypothetical protein
LFAEPVLATVIVNVDDGDGVQQAVLAKKFDKSDDAKIQASGSSGQSKMACDDDVSSTRMTGELVVVAGAADDIKMDDSLSSSIDESSFYMVGATLENSAENPTELSSTSPDISPHLEAVLPPPPPARSATDHKSSSSLLLRNKDEELMSEQRKAKIARMPECAERCLLALSYYLKFECKDTSVGSSAGVVLNDLERIKFHAENELISSKKLSDILHALEENISVWSPKKCADQVDECLKSIRHIDTDLLVDLLKRNHQAALKIQGKDVILLLGVTGKFMHHTLIPIHISPLLLTPTPFFSSPSRLFEFLLFVSIPLILSRN